MTSTRHSPIAIWLLSALLMGILCSCHPIEENPDDPQGNFDALWTEIDTHYCFFSEKQIDWNDVYSRYSACVNPRMTSEELFTLCSQMLDELRDGHVNLSSPYATSYYRKWWSDYPQNYSARIIEQHYFNFNYSQLGPFTFGMLPQNIGYIHVASFSSTIGEGNLDYILGFFATAQALILDVRDNGGGDLTAAERLARRFITQPTLAGTISHKTGPGHDDFSAPRPFYYDPVDASHVSWGKPVVLLANRSTFSAANSFVAFMHTLPGVTLVGATTGGGCGMPLSSELPCGWSIRLSAVVLRDPQGSIAEGGIAPAAGLAVDMDPADALAGRDTILDTAIALILQD